MKCFILFFLSVLTLKAETIRFSAIDGSTQFAAVGNPALIKINGQAPGAEGVLTVKKNLVSGRLFLQLNKITTGIQLRDEHLKLKYFETKKFPTADLLLENIKLPANLKSLSSAEFEMPFTATLKIKDVAKSISGTVRLKKIKDIIQVSSEFTIKLTDYLQNLPSYTGITVGDEVQLVIKTVGKIK